MERKGLYNVLRLNWLKNPDETHVEPWQVEDLRTKSLEELFSQLAKKEILLDELAFAAYANNVDNPEQLTEMLTDTSTTGDITSASAAFDQIYLICFELWRRLCSAKDPLVLLYDELDYQISAYDSGQGSKDKVRQSLAELASFMPHNQPEKAGAAFKIATEECATDLNTFLYDFILETIELDDFAYAE